MKIGIDARLYGLENTGIGRYTMELIHELLKIDSQNQYVFFLRPNHIDDIPDKTNVKKIIVDIRHYTLKEQLKLPKIIAAENLDFIHFPHFNVPLCLKTPFVVTIHDLLWHDVIGYNVTTLNPIIYSLKYLAYRLVVRRSITASRQIITPSKWVKNQLLKRFPVSPQKITITYEGINSSFRPKNIIGPSGMARSFTVKKPFIVYTGSLYPHKNVAVVIKALRKINRTAKTKVSLVLVSARSIFTDQVRQLAYDLDQESFVKFAGFLEDAALARLYREASALIHPSLSEGFGLTGLEAMAVGLPVIASTSGSLPEIYAEAALYFNPKNEQELAQKILQIISQTKLRQTLISAGEKQVQKYSWKTMAEQTLALYEEMGQELKLT